MIRLLALFLLAGCKVTIEPFGSDETPAPEPQTDGPAHDARLGLTDWGDTRTLSIDDGYVFRQMCEGEAITFKFDAHGDVHTFTCGKFSSGVRNTSELSLAREGNGGKEEVRPYDVCHDGHANLTFPAAGEDVQHATLYCPRDGTTHPYPEGWWYTFVIPQTYTATSSDP